MNAEICLKMAIASGVDLYAEAGRLRGRGPRPEPELAATLREHATDARGFSACRSPVRLQIYSYFS
jgi:hypothetical protein